MKHRGWLIGSNRVGDLIGLLLLLHLVHRVHQYCIFLANLIVRAIIFRLRVNEIRTRFEHFVARTFRVCGAIVPLQLRKLKIGGRLVAPFLAASFGARREENQRHDGKVALHSNITVSVNRD